jgi:putative acetyltransferase
MSATACEIRAEAPGDAPAVFAVQAAAFGRPDEARLVDALRGTVERAVSHVAVRDGRVVGHVLVTPVRIETARGRTPECGGLAPLGVEPALQGRGIGGALVRAALAGARELGWPAVFLLGSPVYYGRFGFELAAPRGLHYESHAFDAGFQVHVLLPGALDGIRGFVRYADAFAETSTEPVRQR